MEAVSNEGEQKKKKSLSFRNAFMTYALFLSCCEILYFTRLLLNDILLHQKAI